MLNLAPFLDKDEVLRVGGRLLQSNYSFNKKHPILLPQSHHLTYVIFHNQHIKLMHAGPNQLLETVRERYWPTAGKNTAKQNRQTMRQMHAFQGKG